MPPAPFYPPADASTYRDLFLFEERPKAKAALGREAQTHRNTLSRSARCFLAFQIFIIVLLGLA
ncbi:hypothetical protein EXIGLDRAFT_761263 [Exidia glandulosa HHB12029]|uniref:Uncharacterized protein n=1 Tax=Exidia glandulosa HHB12029 TaxID=1314781 RepID=A0A166BGW1_EXIGL|nr:hypothetical protein EXIGLDRAFT_761263 [Exidia glandulosa HHB12029]